MYKKCKECNVMCEMVKRQRYCDDCKIIRSKKLKNKRNKKYYKKNVTDKKEFHKLLQIFKEIAILELGGKFVPDEYMKKEDNQCPCCFKIYTMTNEDTLVSKEQHITGVCSTICWNKFVKCP